MVFTTAQTVAFFENANQMAIPRATVLELANEGIVTVADLVDFDKESFKQIADNLRRPGGRIPDPTPGAAPGATIPKPPFVFGSKSQTRLQVACKLLRFYQMIGRNITAPNMQWDQVMSNFKEIWQAIEQRKLETGPSTPTINKALPIIKWTEAFRDHLYRCIGDRHIPLAYVVRKDVTVPAICPPLATDQPYSDLHGSVEEDMINRASHSHGLYRADNATVYYKLEEATRSTAYADSIKPFQRTKNGRDAFLALTNQYAGIDKWEAEIKKQSNLLHTRKWKGQSNFPLERFVQQHRNAFVSMTACTQHVQYQLPNELTRVRYLLDALENDDAGLQAAMAGVEADNGPGGMRSDFEKAAAHLIPKCPVVKKRLTATKRTVAEISATSVVDNKPKSGIGLSKVHLRYHTPEEYSKLTKNQKRELMEWRKNLPDSEKKGGAKKAKSVKFIAAVEKQVEKKLAEQTASKAKSEEDDAAMKAYIMSLFKNGMPTTPAQSTAPAAIGATTGAPPSLPPVVNPITIPTNETLAKILARVKNTEEK